MFLLLILAIFIVNNFAVPVNLILDFNIPGEKFEKDVVDSVPAEKTV